MADSMVNSLRPRPRDIIAAGQFRCSVYHCIEHEDENEDEYD